MDKIGAVIGIIFGLVLTIFFRKISFFATERLELFLDVKVNRRIYQIIFLIGGLFLLISSIVDLLK